MDDYLLTLKIRNNRIMQRIREMGHNTVASFCRETGMCPLFVGQLLSMNWSLNLHPNVVENIKGLIPQGIS